jgi:hypothetical protein
MRNLQVGLKASSWVSPEQFCLFAECVTSAFQGLPVFRIADAERSHFCLNGNVSFGFSCDLSRIAMPHAQGRDYSRLERVAAHCPADQTPLSIAFR